MTLAAFELVIGRIGTLWHIVHPKAVVRVSGLEFAVPQRYFVTGGGTTHMVLFTPSLSWGHAEEPSRRWFAKLTLISLLPLSPGASPQTDTDYQRLEAQLGRQAPSQGLKLENTRAIPTSAGMAHCFQFGASQFVEIGCVYDQSRVAVFYAGERPFTPEFYSLISTVRPAS